MNNSHYLIHLPHAGVTIPEHYINDYFLEEEDLLKNIYQYADLYTDELFEKLYQNFGGVKNIQSRLFVDPERFGNDNEELMQQRFGLGWFYENAILEKKPLRSTEHKKEIRIYFDAHHKKLNDLTLKKLNEHDQCTVIDCHSFSDERYWFHDNIKLPDICIGYETIHKDPLLIEIIKAEFSEYDIGINEPYQGSLVPTNYWGKDKRVKSVMIEINKRLYLEKDNLTKSKNFTSIQAKIENIYSALVTL